MKIRIPDALARHLYAVAQRLDVAYASIVRLAAEWHASKAGIDPDPDARPHAVWCPVDDIRYANVRGETFGDGDAYRRAIREWLDADSPMDGVRRSKSKAARRVARVEPAARVQRSDVDAAREMRDASRAAHAAAREQARAHAAAREQVREQARAARGGTKKARAAHAGDARRAEFLAEDPKSRWPTGMTAANVRPGRITGRPTIHVEAVPKVRNHAAGESASERVLAELLRRGCPVDVPTLALALDVSQSTVRGSLYRLLEAGKVTSSNIARRATRSGENRVYEVSA